MPSSRRDPALLHNAICDNQGLICRGRCSHRPAGGSLLHMPLFIRLCVGNHLSPALPELPSKGSCRGFYLCIGSPGGELDVMRLEGWFLIACIKNHGINPAQYCRLKCIKAAKREPSHGYYDEVPILLFLFRVFRRGLFAKRPEPTVKITARSFRLRQSRAWRSGQGRCTTAWGKYHRRDAWSASFRR